jgi:hypothetical protein
MVAAHSGGSSDSQEKKEKQEGAVLQYSLKGMPSMI